MKQQDLNKKVLTGVIILLAVVLLYGLISQAVGRKNFSWKESYSSTNKSPYGSYLVYEMLNNIFQEDSIHSVKNHIFDQLVYSHFDRTNYIIINDYFYTDDADLEEILRFVREGNNLFIAARSFSDDFTSTLGIETTKNPAIDKDSIDIYFTAPDKKRMNFRFPAKNLSTYFSNWDDNNTEVLAETDNKKVKFIRLSLGEGAIYLTTDPLAFTNYYMIHQRNHRYISGAFSYLPDNYTTYWDEYYKRGNYRSKRPGSSNRDARSAWDYIMEQEALRWGFWLVLISLLLYAIFEGKRVQRLIPVITPLPNTTLDFTETVGRLYYQSGDHRKVALKRIKVLLEYIRSYYFLKTQTFDDEFIMSLAGKSGLPKAEIQDLCYLIGRIRNQDSISEHTLTELNQKVEHFYREGAR